MLLFHATIQNSDFGQSDPVDLVIAAGGGGGSSDSGGGAADPSDFTSIVFYDWDGTTVLGSTTVSKTATADEIQAAMDAFTASHMKGGYAPDTYDPYLADYDEAYALNAKRGYSFGKWIDFNAVDANGNEVYTSYGKAVAVQDAISTTDISEPIGHVISEADKNGFIVKAAYVTNEAMEPMNEVSAADYTKRNYTVTAVSYMQFADTTNYSFDVRVQRLNEENGEFTGVHRVRELGLVISLNTGGNTIYMLQRLTNQDDITATVAVNAAVESVDVKVVDLCDSLTENGTSNWATGSASRSNTLTLTPGQNHSNPGFILYGALGFINDQCRVATASGDTPADVIAQTTNSGANISTQNYNDADLSTSSVAGTSGGSAARRRGAFANILAMYQSLPAPRKLTWDEMQEAILRGTIWNDGNWTNGFTGTFIPG